MTTYVFPGQGSQTKGMGSALFPLFPELVKIADDLLGYSIQTLCEEDPEQKLNQTHYTQPALYVVNALSYLKKCEETTEKPKYFAGHSLGEYNALFAAGAFSFETGLKLVQKRGALMNQAMQGGMAAIIGLKSDEVQSILEAHHLTEVSIANYNSHTQVVISGVKEKVIAAKSFFEMAGAKLFIPLKVSGAFHSPFMEAAKQEFEQFLLDYTFSPLSTPVIANVNARPYVFEEISFNLSAQITHPVLWTQSMEYLIAQKETVFEEVGPGRVLAGLITRIQKGQ